MSTNVKRLLVGGLVVAVILGMGILLGPGKGDDPTVTLGATPTEVFGGGGDQLTIEVQVNAPGVVAVSFERRMPVDDKSQKFFQTSQKVPQGKHLFNLDVPEQVRGSIDVRVDKPSVGAEILVRLKANGEPVAEETKKLTEPLPEGSDFSAQLKFEDYLIEQSSPVDGGA